MQNDILKGGQANDGSVTLSYLESTSPTEILARSIVINDKLYAEESPMVAGNNYVDKNGKITGTVKVREASRAVELTLPLLVECTLIKLT